MIVKSFFLSGFCLSQQTLQRFSLATRLIGCSFACCLVWLLTSCTAMQPVPEDNPPVAAAVQIALAYEQDGDLAHAQESLQALDVANPNQWLLSLAESEIAAATGAATTTPLVRLALALDLASTPIQEYADQHGLLADPPTLPPQDPPSAEQETVAGEQAPADQAADAQPATQLSSDAVGDPLEPTTTPVDAAPDAPPDADVADVADVDADNAPAGVAPPPTVAVIVLIPTPTPTPVARSLAQALNALNVRGGPGTDYAVVGGLEPGAQVEITGRNANADWWQILLPDGGEGWVYAPLVETGVNATTVALAATIPEPPPPPTPTPEPSVAVPSTPVQPEPAPEQSEEVADPAESAPEAEEPAPAAGGPNFRVIEKRLWDVVENGGGLDGNSVRCGERRQLQVIVVDANGVRLSGVPVQVQYGAREVIVTGTHGEGAAEFVLGHGQDVAVIRDVDGRAVTSEVATGLVTVPWEIPYEHLIAGRFCTDNASCASFVNATGCYGHYSWTVIFQRSY